MIYRSILTAPALLTATTALILLSGCTSLPATQGADADNDPFEGFNRSIYSFNEGVDKAVLKPVATGYKNTVPQPVRTGVSNFFSNLAYPTVIINDFLQGKFAQGMEDTGRFVANSVFGVVGIFDVATGWEMPAHKEDFGQTFGVWGIGEGPYLVLPLFGPSNPRDGVGALLNYQTDILSYYANDAGRLAAQAVKVIDNRADLLSAGRILDQAALDPYSFTRNIYRQRRTSLIHDGNLPQQDFLNDPTENSGFEPEPASTDSEPELPVTEAKPQR